MATRCYYCDSEAEGWIDWTIYEIPGAYGGGKLVTIVPLCNFHYEFIEDSLVEIEAIVS